MSDNAEKKVEKISVKNRMGKNQYKYLHNWVAKHLGRPKKCAECGTEKARQFDWSNVSGKYLRELSDWVRLCQKCHFDKDKWFGVNKTKVKKIIGDGKFEIFESLRDAERSVGVDNPNSGGLSNHLNGRRKSYKGFIWERTSDEQR